MNTNRIPVRAVLTFGLVLIGLVASAASTLAQGPQIKNVIVAQVLGNQMGKYVAGKDAALVIVLDQPTVVDPASQQVVVKLGADTVTTLQPAGLANLPNVLFFLCPTRAACGDWKAGDYTFEAKVGNATATATAKFQERSGLAVIMLPVKANYGPGDVRSTTGTWKTLLYFTRQVYPIAPDKWKVKMGHEIDASGDQYNTLTPEGRQALTLLVIEAAQQRACFEQPRPADINCYDSISGFVKDRLGPGGTLQGFAYKVVKTNINVESDADASATVAHEIGHLFNLGDEYQGGAFNCPLNPPPASYVGKDFNNPEAQGLSCKESKSGEPPQGYTGSAVKASDDLPIELGGRGPLMTDLTTFMGNGPKQEGFWITPVNWSALFDAFDPAKKGASAMVKNAAPVVATQSRWIFAMGSIGKNDKVLTLPWYSFSDSHEHKDSTGKLYSLRSVDAQGKTLASDALSIEFGGLDNKGDADFSLFEISVPYPDSTAAFQIVKGDKVLKEIKVSANAPTVKVTAPKAGETLDKTYTFKWEGSDKDGDKLYYAIDYSIDGQDWITLADNIEKNELTVDLSDLPGNDKPTARIMVSATDGMNATDVESETFSVAPRAPVVDIESPKPSAGYKIGEVVSLKGTAYDYQDGEITGDDTLVWTSDIQGDLGKGELVNLNNLKQGKHVIMLKATNSFKVSGTASITIYVGVTPPTPTATATPAPTSAATSTQSTVTPTPAK